MQSTALLTSLDASRIQLKAGGLFVVGTHLIPAVILSNVFVLHMKM